MIFCESMNILPIKGNIMNESQICQYDNIYKYLHFSQSTFRYASNDNKERILSISPVEIHHHFINGLLKGKP